MAAHRYHSRSSAHRFLATQHPRECRDKRAQGRQHQPPNEHEPVRTAEQVQLSAHHCADSPDPTVASSKKLWHAAGQLEICQSQAAHLGGGHARSRKRVQRSKNRGRFRRKVRKRKKASTDRKTAKRSRKRR